MLLFNVVWMGSMSGIGERAEPFIPTSSPILLIFFLAYVLARLLMVLPTKVAIVPQNLSRLISFLKKFVNWPSKCKYRDKG